MTTKKRLELSMRLLSSIDARREQCADTAFFSSVEREIVDRELKDLAQEWAQDPEAPRVVNIRSVR